MFFFLCMWLTLLFTFFFFNDTATTEIYTLSLHDALPISVHDVPKGSIVRATEHGLGLAECLTRQNTHVLQCDRISFLDRKSTRLNSSHSQISYAVFCLKKKKQK